jgi:ABC-type bacteriocin/lantibiotic exporter with double-glycine peptidase domain
VPVLHDINLTVPAGSTLALVGASGAGKSTLVDLLLGLQAPTTGQITCGSIDIHKNLIDWQSQVGLVPQDVFLLDASLRENIVFDVAEKDIDEEWLKETVRLARLTELVESTPEGLNLMVGDRGVRISGGQKQRIAIARALYKKPSILILDEATSALDNETERQITQTIEGLAGEITVIVVAHRLSTVKGCDQFLVLNQGKAEALGTLQQVKKSSKTFANLAKLASLEV